MTQHNEAGLFFRKAMEDELLLDKLIDDSDIADSIWGFHAQQAAEKFIKSVLMEKSILFPKTHDLMLLHDLMVQNGLVCPVLFEELGELGPFAVEFRYDGNSVVSIDRHAVKKVISKLHVWAEVILQGTG
ncbi:HEPN domain-containing protein [Bdellovibrionota bacterium FG-1]